MKQWQKGFLMSVFALVFFMRPFLTVLAADSSVIETLSITFKTQYGEAEEIPEPTITVGTKKCTLLDYQYAKEAGSWRPGKKVRITLTIQAEDGKYFPVSMTETQCKVSGATFVSAKSSADHTIQIKVDYVPVTVLGVTEQAGWKTNNKKTAVWKSVAYAPGYTITLYGDNKKVKSLTVSTNSADLSAYMEDMDKNYYYEVKAVPTTSAEKKYLKEGGVVVSTEQEFDLEDFEAEEERNQTPEDGGKLEGDFYVLPDGSHARNVWKKISGKWYYFDGSGMRVKGWLCDGGRWYYMDSEGVLCTGWIQPSGDTWYYLKESGEMRTGWFQTDPGTWYYFGTDGRMQTGWIYVQGKWYYMASDGRMKIGWLLDGGKWYYLNLQGDMAVNTKIDDWHIGADGVAYQLPK